MNQEQLWETTMNPKNRIMKQVTMDDSAAVEPGIYHAYGRRSPTEKEIYSDHAKSATLDI